MMKKIILLIISVSLLYSCQENKEEDAELIVPENLLSKEDFKELMIDIHLLEATQKLNLLEGIDDTTKVDVFYQAIFDKYEIDLENFQTTHDYYSADKKAFFEFYEELTDELERREKQLKR